MKLHWRVLISINIFGTVTSALKYSADQVGYNLNQNETAVDPLHYWGEWPDHDFFPSPSNWRRPMYTLFLDRFVNGLAFSLDWWTSLTCMSDPSNDNANNTQFEHDLLSNQLRYGGDTKGLQDTLDYLQGMGVKILYIAGSPFINMPWGSDGYSPLDLTLLDRHFGTIDAWREMVSDVHSRGMYIVLDNTFATMGDLLGFEGHLNESAKFNPKEYNAVWKSERRYHDFVQSNAYLDKCEYPRFWSSLGEVVTNTTDYFVGCRDSEFDQYGEVASFGNYQEYERQLSKFAFVQDRLREWRPSVLAKIEHFSCMTIAMLDIDGFRIDKALQVTLDSQAAWSAYIRKCAKKYNKDNFYIPGEIVAGNAFGATYIGRGMEPEMRVDNITEVVTVTNKSGRAYIRDHESSALDGSAFHYSVYRSMTRFLGMDGIYAAEGDPPVNFVETWRELMQTNDMANAYTGEFDPRHMYGITNQDVFRWPGIQNGTEKQLLGLFIVTLLFPGIPTLSWGEEQATYVLENTEDNYVFGRPPMASSLAWQLHGCYQVGSVKYASFPLDKALWGCQDDNISLDHRDSAHPVRNIIKRMFEMRETYPVLQDGFYLQQLSNHTYNLYLPGSNNTPTETGLWSVYRSAFTGVQNFTGIGQEGQSVWLLYSNENRTVDYSFDCLNNDSLVAPFDEATVVRNLFAPYEEYTLRPGSKKLGLEGSTKANGCIQNLTMLPWGYKALVPKEKFVSPNPAITSFYPGHDMRVLSTDNRGEKMHIKIEFSDEMDCKSISNSLRIDSTVETGGKATLDPGSVRCSSLSQSPWTWVGEPRAVFTYEADLSNVRHGVHQVTVINATGTNGNLTNSVDRFLFRCGNFDNPMVFPKAANYSKSLLFKDDGRLHVSHSAAGADLWRYSLNFGTTFSEWATYTGGNSTLDSRVWSGTKRQAWKGDHVIVQYWTRMGGSSDHYVHGDLDSDLPPRRFPNMFLMGPFNRFGSDAGLSNQMQLNSDGLWKIDFMDEWPAQVQLNAWGINPDGKPDVSAIYGDLDGDHVLDRIPPQSLLTNMVNLTDVPPSPHLSYRLQLNDGSLKYELIPVGSRWNQLTLYLLLGILPILTAASAALIFVKSFYQIKFNEFGTSQGKSSIQLLLLRFNPKSKPRQDVSFFTKANTYPRHSSPKASLLKSSPPLSPSPTPQGGRFKDSPLVADAGAPNRRVVLIATMEYDIEDWGIKIKIGGLGVMAQLMGKNLGHQDLIWVVPCVGGIEYPDDPNEVAEPMEVTVFEQIYQIHVRTHRLRNITYVLLDAPVFRQQSKSEPYPPRMDDLDSAIYYSAWNSCIAETIRRYKPDLYHINDYHGAVAPLHILPDTIPCALSLHNAEFQGLWPMRSKEEREEVCKVYNLDLEIVEEYVQFGEVFNLLHAAASYLRIHQKGFGAVGVSKKYGKRSYARYPIFWGLKEIKALPNPDPSDTGEWHRDEVGQKPADIQVDPQFEAERGALRVDAQKWAGLNVNPTADLFVFVGRWSMQKGVDLIADIFPSILEKYQNTQLICIGPVIDLYGKFAAIKLDKMMSVYPGRVFSKPEFTALPPYIFSGAEFALIPSRDEPFGLVAVEFGRKGALGVGARVGGLGQMPGWWYTVESTSTKHLLHQFKGAIEGALESDDKTRALLRARSARQRFPVAQWVEDLETLQTTAIQRHEKYSRGHKRRSLLGELGGWATPANRSRATSRAPSEAPSEALGGRKRISLLGELGGWPSPANRSRAASRPPSEVPSEVPSEAPSPKRNSSPAPALPDPTSSETLQRMGSRRGPGHVHKPRRDRTSDGTLLEEDEEDILDHYLSSPRQSDDGDDDQPRGRSVQVKHPVNGLGLSGVSPNGMELPSGSATGNGLSAQLLGHHATSPMPLASHHDRQADTNMLSAPAGNPVARFRAINESSLSLASVVGEKKDFELQKVNPFFTDAKQDYSKAFEKRLADLSAKNSYNTCIEEFIEKSEKEWFNRLRDRKMGKTATPASSIFRSRRNDFPTPSFYSESVDGWEGDDQDDADDQFLLKPDYKPPTGVKKLMLHRLGEWPVYSLLLAFGQIIAANSYQITLLTGEVGQSETKLYTVASIYLATSILWWAVFRIFKSVYVLSVPFIFYGLAFFMVGLAPLVTSFSGRGWVQNVAIGCYATASSSGSIFFSLNFGDQGGAPVSSWVFRACVIQGTQQVYIAGLWWWGSTLSRSSDAGTEFSSLVVAKPEVLTTASLIIAVFLWVVGAVLFLGLPDYYRQMPGKVPSFLVSLFRRKIVLWFFMTVLIQNFFLSAPYGRNWLYLWSSKHIHAYQIGLLVVLFFILVWAALLYAFNVLSKSHTWILPLFAIGLGAPRWCQMLWGTSGIGQYVPWAGSPVGSAIAGRSLWLWLGVLDSLQGVGFGMILLHTLTRFHITFTLTTAQVLGSIATVAARGFGPNKIGPGPVFPNFSVSIANGLGQPWFWIALFAQLTINVVALLFFRKEQLSKP